MRDTLRLLVTEDCNRRCAGCCNKDFDLAHLDIVQTNELQKYKMIILTGGEPLLYPLMVMELANKIREYSDAKIVLYTAKTDNIVLLVNLMTLCDSITLTLHTQSDYENFIVLQQYIIKRPEIYEQWENKRFRLNVFNNVWINVKSIDTQLWDVKKNIEWIEDCPLPSNEVFKRLT